MGSTQRFLVKMPPLPAGTGVFGISGQGPQFTARPLMPSVDRKPSGLGIAQGSQWHLVETKLAIDTMSAWDVCHAMMTRGFGISGAASPEFAEPDWSQHWVSDQDDQKKVGLTAACEQAPQNDDFPCVPGDPLWYQGDDHGQFQKALDSLNLKADGPAVRVAHMDTGYDPTHQSLPARLEKEFQRNFVDADRPNDATDDSSGLFNNAGHGTGTLSILAGTPCGGLDRLGAAAFVDVVPIRVANRVEIFYTSAIAQAFDYVHSLCDDPKSRVDIVTMSMGGLASQAWAEAVNALYDAGVFVVTAAGNNFGNAPTHNVVYPARFNRVVAACGVMADGKPYADLSITKMAGNYGPTSKMQTAISAYTPNVPWARFGCPGIVNLSGQGTSAATPQVAAAAAIWLRKFKAKCDAYADPWMRVEAVRKALFDSALQADSEHCGRGLLKVADALNMEPAPADQLRAQPADSASFGFLKVLTGLGIDSVDEARLRMLELEALQLSQSTAIESVLSDPGVPADRLTMVQRAALAKALAEHPRASQALQRALKIVPSAPVRAQTQQLSGAMAALQLSNALNPVAPEPATRRLRIFAYDPSLGRRLETVSLNETTVNVRWEPKLEPGPVGEYLEVVDMDPASDSCYAPIDLDSPRLLATDGLRPSESNPQFHQQMVYAVSMKTIEHFEHALGRRSLWAPRLIVVPTNSKAALQAVAAEAGPACAVVPASMGGGLEVLATQGDSSTTHVSAQYVQRLRIYPHALREQNAYYSPERKALLLGYFGSKFDVETAPSQMIFTALSHDIVAHETTHALLDGIHRYFSEPTNPDVLAFHEAFADIVALFQHFTLRDSLRDQMARARGSVTDRDTLLAKLAVEFGEATGRRGGLRNAIGKMVVDDATKEEVWVPAKPSVKDYLSSNESHDPHEHGSVLVAAVFDAFSQIYARRAVIPIRLATGGSEVLPDGALPAYLVDALTDVASKVAKHVLTMCIRALDYCPPVDITFGDFLRALITADRDLVPTDPWGYRVAFVSAFSARGIFPEAVRSLSIETVVWEPPPVDLVDFSELLPNLDLKWNMQTKRHRAWESSLQNARKVHDWLMDANKVSDDVLASLGLRRKPEKGCCLKNADGESIECDVNGLEVHSVRPLRRVGPDGQLLAQLVIELTQTAWSGQDGFKLRGGVTLLFDLTTLSAVYMIRKRLDQAARINRSQQAFAALQEQSANVYTGLAMQRREPFAFLHHH